MLELSGWELLRRNWSHSSHRFMRGGFILSYFVKPVHKLSCRILLGGSIGKHLFKLSNG